MAPTKTGAKDGEENSPHSGVLKNLSLRGEGHPLSPAASSAPKYCGSDGGRLAESTRSGEEMVPTKTGANNGEENSSRRSSAKNLPLRGEGCPLSLSASSAPNYGGGDGSRSADSMCSGGEMTLTKTGPKDR